MQLKLTENRINGLPVKPKSYAVRDAAVAGFFVDVNKTSKSYKVQADLWQGARGQRQFVRTVKVTLGRVGELPLDVARVRAAELIARIKAGEDPRPKGLIVAPIVWTVEKAFTEYLADLLKSGGAERTAADARRCLGYLEPWHALPLTEITKAMTRDRHALVTKTNGPIAANMALRAYRKVFNFASKVLDVSLGENPVVAVTFNKERSGNRCVDSLSDWYRRLQKLTNPMRRLMHEFGLFSGLRPHNLVALEKAWVRLDDRAIVIPADRMKGRREFALPLSTHLVDLVGRILALSEIVEARSPFLFPTRNRNGEVVATQVWSERLLGSETGHTLRHTYSNCARLAGVDDVDRELLLAHKIPGVQGIYLHTPTLFSRLLDAQERVSAFIAGRVAQ
jgi:integrase